MLLKCFLDDIINAQGWKELYDVDFQPLLPPGLTLKQSVAILTSSLAGSLGFSLQYFPLTRSRDLKPMRLHQNRPNSVIMQNPEPADDRSRWQVHSQPPLAVATL